MSYRQRIGNYARQKQSFPPLDPSTFQFKASTAYNDTVVVAQGDAQLRPILNKGSTAYNDTVVVGQGSSLLRPIINKGSTAYNDTVVIP